MMRSELFLILVSPWLLTVPLTAAENVELKLWPNGAPGEKLELGPEAAQPPRENENPPVIRLANVSEPTLTLFPAPKEKTNGCAVLVCPGGGYNILAWNLEGTEVAEWLNSIGVTAAVLKYRVPRRDKDQPHAAPLQDAQRAMRLVRANADPWGVDVKRVGILGFSAGGHLTVMTGTKWNESSYARIDEADDLSCRPDFLIPIYAAYLGDKQDDTRLSPLVRVTKQTPPTFMAVTYDDKLRGLHAALLLAELKKAGVPAELHVYAKGGHGYGLRPSTDPVSAWPALCEKWLRSAATDKRAQ